MYLLLLTNKQPICLSMLFVFLHVLYFVFLFFVQAYSVQAYSVQAYSIFQAYSVYLSTAVRSVRYASPWSPLAEASGPLSQNPGLVKC